MESFGLCTVTHVQRQQGCLHAQVYKGSVQARSLGGPAHSRSCRPGVSHSI